MLAKYIFKNKMVWGKGRLFTRYLYHGGEVRETRSDGDGSREEREKGGGKY